MPRSIFRIGATGLTAALGLEVTAAQLPPISTPPGATAPAPPKPAGPVVVATVQGEAIPLDRVDAVIKVKFAVLPLAPGQVRQLRTEVAGDMVDDILLRHFLTKYGPKVESAELDQYVKGFTASLTKEGKTFAGFLAETGQTEAALRESWATMLQLSGYVRLHVTDAQLRQYFAANRDHFDRTEVKASHIEIRVGPTSPPGERAAAKQKLRALRAEIAAGMHDFAAAAKKHSQCQSAPAGGDLGYIPRRGGLMDESFCKAAFALKVGEISDVVETEYGVHLIKVTGRKPGTPTTFEKCIEDVRDTFTEDFRTELVAKLRKQAAVRITVP